MGGVVFAVDSFVKDNKGGNPAGVVLDADDLIKKDKINEVLVGGTAIIRDELTFEQL